jgi:hypothetical protein
VGPRLWPVLPGLLRRRRADTKLFDEKPAPGAPVAPKAPLALIRFSLAWVSPEPSCDRPPGAGAPTSGSSCPMGTSSTPPQALVSPFTPWLMILELSIIALIALMLF